MDVAPAAIDDALRRTIDNGGRVCVLTGAGMSAESGIPTFRGTHDSLWSRFDPMRLATAEAALRNGADATAIAAAAEAARAATTHPGDFRGDAAYRAEMAAVLTRRVLAALPS